jgi:hypothetical protein
MATNITKMEPAGPAMPAYPPPALTRLVMATLSGAETHGAITVLLPGKELDAGERSQIEGRLSTLRRSLEHRDNQQIAKAVARLMASYSSARGSDDEARSTLTAYTSVLADLPPWGVSEACQAWVRGGYGATASAFVPSAAQLREAASMIYSKFKREADDLERVLSARLTPITDAERQRVSSGFDQLKADLIADRLKAELSTPT